jgi:hypothetical protein
VRRRVSPWWYAVAAVIAVVSVVVGGIAVGLAARRTVALAFDAAIGSTQFFPGRQLSLDMTDGDVRLLFATVDPTTVPTRAWWCNAQPAGGSAALPRTWQLRPDDTVGLPTTSTTWWLIGKVETRADGAVVVTCDTAGRRTSEDNLQFAITPNLDPGVVKTAIRHVAVAVALMLLGLVAAAVAAVIVLALRASSSVSPRGG